MARADEPREETASERADRNLSELLQELRVALPGVQVVIIRLPTHGAVHTAIRELTEFQKDLSFATLLCTALATAF